MKRKLKRAYAEAYKAEIAWRLAGQPVPSPEWTARREQWIKVRDLDGDVSEMDHASR